MRLSSCWHCVLTGTLYNWTPTPPNILQWSSRQRVGMVPLLHLLFDLRYLRLRGCDCFSIRRYFFRPKYFNVPQKIRNTAGNHWSAQLQRRTEPSQGPEDSEGHLFDAHGTERVSFLTDYQISM